MTPFLDNGPFPYYLIDQGCRVSSTELQIGQHGVASIETA